MANLFLLLTDTVSILDAPSLQFGIWWLLLEGIRSANFPSEVDAVVFTAQAPVVQVSAAPSVTTVVGEVSNVQVSAEINVMPVVGEPVQGEVDC
jgi:hypothetical protein